MFIKVKVIPSAKKESIVKKNEDTFEINVKEPPVNGLASQRVLLVLSDYLKIKKEKIRLVRGIKRRSKIFEILD